MFNNISRSAAQWDIYTDTFFTCFSEEETANLSSEEKSEIMRLLPPSTSASQCQEVTELLNQANIKSMNVGEEDITEQLQVKV